MVEITDEMKAIQKRILELSEAIGDIKTQIEASHSKGAALEELKAKLEEISKWRDELKEEKAAIARKAAEDAARKKGDPLPPPVPAIQGGDELGFFE